MHEENIKFKTANGYEIQLTTRGRRKAAFTLYLNGDHVAEGEFGTVHQALVCAQTAIDLYESYEA